MKKFVIERRKKRNTKTCVKLRVNFSTPRRDWYVAPPPPQALPSPPPLPWIKMRATMASDMMILRISRIDFTFVRITDNVSTIKIY